MNGTDLSPLFDDENPDLQQEARDVIGDWWWTTPNSHLAGQTPEEVVNDNRGAQVRNLLRIIKYIGSS